MTKEVPEPDQTELQTRKLIGEEGIKGIPPPGRPDQAERTSPLALQELIGLDPKEYGWESIAELLLHSSRLIQEPAYPVPELPPDRRGGYTVGQLIEIAIEHAGPDAARQWARERELYRRTVRSVVRRWRRRGIL